MSIQLCQHFLPSAPHQAAVRLHPLQNIALNVRNVKEVRHGAQQLLPRLPTAPHFRKAGDTRRRVRLGTTQILDALVEAEAKSALGQVRLHLRRLEVVVVGSMIPT